MSWIGSLRCFLQQSSDVISQVPAFIPFPSPRLHVLATCVCVRVWASAHWISDSLPLERGSVLRVSRFVNQKACRQQTGPLLHSQETWPRGGFHLLLSSSPASAGCTHKSLPCVLLRLQACCLLCVCTVPLRAVIFPRRCPARLLSPRVAPPRIPTRHLTVLPSLSPSSPALFCLGFIFAESPYPQSPLRLTRACIRLLSFFAAFLLHFSTVPLFSCLRFSFLPFLCSLALFPFPPSPCLCFHLFSSSSAFAFAPSLLLVLCVVSYLYTTCLLTFLPLSRPYLVHSTPV